MKKSTRAALLTSAFFLSISLAGLGGMELLHRSALEEAGRIHHVEERGEEQTSFLVLDDPDGIALPPWSWYEEESCVSLDEYFGTRLGELDSLEEKLRELDRLEAEKRSEVFRLLNRFAGLLSLAGDRGRELEISPGALQNWMLDKLPQALRFDRRRRLVFLHQFPCTVGEGALLADAALDLDGGVALYLRWDGGEADALTREQLLEEKEQFLTLSRQYVENYWAVWGVSPANAYEELAPELQENPLISFWREFSLRCSPQIPLVLRQENPREIEVDVVAHRGRLYQILTGAQGHVVTVYHPDERRVVGIAIY